MLACPLMQTMALLKVFMSMCYNFTFLYIQFDCFLVTKLGLCSGLGTKTHLVRVRTKITISSEKYINTCLDAVLNSGHWLGSFLA